MAKCCLLFQAVTAPTVANLQQKAIRMSGLYPTFSRARASGYGKASTFVSGSCAHSSTNLE
jgi:hypothetical protein